MLTFISVQLFQKLNYKQKNSKVRDFFLSGSEWEPIMNSVSILEQIKAYQE